jgi:hypothetical protein
VCPGPPQIADPPHSLVHLHLSSCTQVPYEVEPSSHSHTTGALTPAVLGCRSNSRSSLQRRRSRCLFPSPIPPLSCSFAPSLCQTVRLLVLLSVSVFAAASASVSVSAHLVPVSGGLLAGLAVVDAVGLEEAPLRMRGVEGGREGFNRDFLANRFRIKEVYLSLKRVG